MQTASHGSSDLLHLDVQSPNAAIVIATSHNHLFLKVRDENSPLGKSTMLLWQTCFLQKFSKSALKITV